MDAAAIITTVIDAEHLISLVEEATSIRAIYEIVSLVKPDVFHPCSLISSIYACISELLLSLPWWNRWIGVCEKIMRLSCVFVIHTSKVFVLDRNDNIILDLGVSLVPYFKPCTFTTIVYYDDGRGMKMSYNCFSEWQRNGNRLEVCDVVYNITAEYGLCTIGQRTFFKKCRGLAVPPRLFQGTLEDAKEISEPFLLFMKHVICDGYEKVYNYVRKLCAWIFVQRPGTLTKVCLALISNDEQAGKGSFISILCSILGEDHVVVQAATVMDSFTPAGDQNFIMWMDDTSPINKERYCRFKHRITEKRVHVNPKGKQEHVTENKCNHIITSNHEDVVPYENGAARVVLLRTNSLFAGRNSGENVHVPWLPHTDSDNNRIMGTQVTKAQFFQMLHDIPKEAISTVLNCEDLSQFDPTCQPMTLLMQERKLAQLSCVELFARHILQEGHVCLDEKSWAWHATMPQPCVYAAFKVYMRRKKNLLKSRSDYKIFQHDCCEKFWNILKSIISFRHVGNQRINSGNPQKMIQWDPLDECRKKFCDALGMEGYNVFI